MWTWCRRYWEQSPIQIWCIYVEAFLSWTEKFEKQFTKWRLAGERKLPMTSNLEWGHLSSSSTSGPNLVIVAQTVFKRSRHRDDGVRDLCHKCLRQLRWARALKTPSRISQINGNSWFYGKHVYIFLGSKGHLGSIFLQNQVGANDMNTFYNYDISARRTVIELQQFIRLVIQTPTSHLQGHPRSKLMVPLERASMSFYLKVSKRMT